MSSAKDRRKVKGLFPDPDAQFRLMMPLGVMFLFTLLLVVGMAWYLFQELEFILLTSNVTGAANAEISNLVGNLVMFAAFGTVAAGVLCVYLCLRMTTRVFGPIVAIRRYIRKLAAGDYSTELRLRQKDEFKMLMNELNELRASLQKRESGAAAAPQSAQ